jgi:brefeldin A-resistance guanine nucleotide exchange factor 1
MFLDLSQLDALTLLSPFLAVVRSDEANGPITALALSSIDKFLTYSFIHPQSSSLTLAMSQISAAGTHCRFEASDSISDEIVLLKILDVLKHALTGPVGYTLTDEAVCQMMETGLSMCCQMRLSGTTSLVDSLSFFFFFFFFFNMHQFLPRV